MRHRPSLGGDGGALRCSFCHKKQEKVGKLISSPSDYPRAYICDECIAVCATILEDDRAEADGSVSPPLLGHPLVPELLDCIEQWTTRETAGEDSAQELARLRDLAQNMVRPPGTMLRATGTFEVKLDHCPEDGSPLECTTLSKQYHGDLTASGKGQMLSATGHINGSAGYVAMELVSGLLHGRSGTCVLQHSGRMNRGEPTLSVTVVPDSGTGEWTGIAGTMAIVSDGDVHSYNFQYSLAETQ